MTPATQPKEPLSADRQSPEPLRQAGANPPAEVVSLLAQLNDQREATVRALRCAEAITAQLAQTREELQRALMLGSVPPAPQPEPEEDGGAAAHEAELHRASEELAQERRARDEDQAQAAARIARLEEMVTTMVATERTALRSLRRGRLLLVMLTLALICGAPLLANLAARYPATALAAALRNALASPREPAKDGAGGDAAGQADAGRTLGGPGLAPETALKLAVARLNRAIAAYPELKPQDVVAALRSGRINVDPSSCLLAWNDGQPELLLQHQRSDSATLASTLTACASALENARHDTIRSASDSR